MKKEMLINVLQPEECRIAIVEDGVLEELYVERTSHESYTGNIYKGKIVNLEPAIQAAFVDFSVGRNGFLHVSDVEPQYYRRLLGEDVELGGRDRNREFRLEHDKPRSPRGGERRPRSAPPPPPSGEERGRDRDRDRHRDLDRDRPDLSERGRRDRSAPRRFGEGLTDEEEGWVAPPPPVPAPETFEPEPAAPAQPPLESALPVSEEPVVPRPETASFGWIEETQTEPPPLSPESDEPRARMPRPLESYEADLPPSRTHRGYAAQGRVEEFGAETGPAWPAPEPREIEPLPDVPPSPERRRGRGRGRSQRPVSGPELSPEPQSTELPTQSEPPGEERLEPPRRRSGRAAIRSRGGDRGPERPRSFGIERPEQPGAEGIAEPESERPRGRSRERESEGGRGLESEPTPQRATPHARAGEPGYVPRRERARPPEREFGAQIEPESELDWAELEPPLESEEAGVETEPEAPESASGPRKALGPRRRRRRRRRRGERFEREPSSLSSGEGEEDEDEDEVDDYADTEVAERAAVGDEAPHLQDFEFDEEIDEEHGAATGLPEAPRVLVPEEEIDPELQEEIRREVEEIAALEREMGLRGPVEARPRRGDERGPESPRTAHAPRGRGLAKPPIQEIFKRGDEVLVQVIKESIGTKGPTLSTYISIPGRYLVLMPGLNRVGVSRKIADESQRRKLREIMHELNPPKGLGFIVRTAGLERSKRELARDLAYLLRLWKVILRRIKKTRAPAPIYQESDMITRTIRDIFTSEIDTIWIDERSAFERAQEFLRVVMPRFVNRLKFYDEKVPLFHKYGIEEEIAKIQRRHIPLPEGGSIVIDQTEALVAIDVNSGNFRVENDAERTAFEMNLRAAKEIARQLRLRDLGGVIVNDFIDMREERNRRGVERALREAIKRDRARTKVLRMSAFGIIEMTRQRIRPSLRRSVYEDCTHCNGAGVVKTAESMAIDVMRLLALAAHREEIRRINVCVCAAVSNYLNNRKRREIARMENDANMTVHIRHEEDVPAEHLQIDCYDSQNNEVRLLPAPPPPPRRGR